MVGAQGVPNEKLPLIDVISVIYNKEINLNELSEVLNSEFTGKVIICDNSTDQACLKCNGMLNNEKVDYIGMGGNKGLSIAYSIAVNRADAPYVLMLDDDTKLPNGFFDQVARHIKEDAQIDIFLPVVRSSRIIMSPCKKGKYRISKFNKIDDISGSLSAINSGMIIKRTVFSRISYREDLFLDMVDHAFMDSARDAGLKITVMDDVKLTQDYSRETDDRDASMRRFEITKRDNRAYYSGTVGSRLFCEVQLVYWKVCQLIKFSIKPKLTFKRRSK